MSSFHHIFSFENVASKQHILFRNFNFISSTIHNRHSFISQFNTIFKNFYSSQIKVTGDEIHQLLCLLCPDFPTCLIYLSLSIFDNKHSKEFPFIVLTDVILNIFLYWDILQYVEELYHNNIVNINDNYDMNKKNETEYRDYVFIGEIRTAIFEYKLKYPQKF